jgi:hypothetical protein
MNVQHGRARSVNCARDRVWDSRVHLPLRVVRSRESDSRDSALRAATITDMKRARES